MKDFPAFCLALSKDGKLWASPAQEKVMTTYLRNHDGQYVRWVYQQPTKERSNAENRYYWGVVLTMIAAETGHTCEECHEFMKSQFLPRKFIQIGETMQQLTKSTTTLSTLEMEEYLEHIRAFAATELSLTIPLPHQTGLE